MNKKEICPKCGSDNTVYMNEKQIGMTLRVNNMCRNCTERFTDVFRIVYIRKEKPMPGKIYD